MSTFTPEELTLICLYDPGTRLGAVEELRNMMQYLMVDELSAEIIPDFSPIISG